MAQNRLMFDFFKKKPKPEPTKTEPVAHVEPAAVAETVDAEPVALTEAVAESVPEGAAGTPRGGQRGHHRAAAAQRGRGNSALARI